MHGLRGYRKEVLAYLGIMTRVRLVNLLKLYLSHALSKSFKKNLHTGQPAYLTLETTNSCNLSCPECVTGMNGLTRKTAWMSAAMAGAVFKETSSKAWVANLYFQGEPLLNPEIMEIIKLTSSHRLFGILSTNAQNLSKEKARNIVHAGLKKIIISLDGLTQETYGKYRIRGQVQQVLDGLKNMVEARRESGQIYPVIEVQFIVFRFNEHEIAGARKQVYAMGCDRFVAKTAQFYDRQRAMEWQPKNPKYSRYRAGSAVEIKQKATRGCKKMWTSLVVCAGGEVALCCMDKNAQFSSGNVNGDGIRTVWKNAPIEVYRQKVVSGNYLSICENCPLKG